MLWKAPVLSQNAGWMGTYMNSDSTHYKQKLQSLNINELPSKKLQFTWIPRWFFPAWLTVTLLNNFYWNKKEFHRCSLPWFPWIKDIMWLHETRQIVMCFCDVYKAIIIHIDKKLLIFVTLLSSCGDCSASYCAFIFCCSCSGHLIIPQLPST